MKSIIKILAVYSAIGVFTNIVFAQNVEFKKGNYTEEFEKSLLRVLQNKAEDSFTVISPIVQKGDLEIVEEGILVNTFKLALGEENAKNEISLILTDMVQNYIGNNVIKDLGLSKTVADNIALTSREGAKNIFDEMGFDQIIKESTKFSEIKYDVKEIMSKQSIKQEFAIKEATNQGEARKQKEIELLLNSVSAMSEKTLKDNLNKKVRPEEVKAVVSYLKTQIGSQEISANKN